MFKFVQQVGAFVAKHKQSKAETLANKQAAKPKHGWLSPNFGASPSMTANSSSRSLNDFAAGATGSAMSSKTDMIHQRPNKSEHLLHYFDSDGTTALQRASNQILGPQHSSPNLHLLQTHPLPEHTCCIQPELYIPGQWAGFTGVCYWCGWVEHINQNHLSCSR